ncbi:MAG: InlB B-repeat-containing protein [Eubacterium sp.]|nr:InlB B-repeat-containing protein [Eubacterium sp.]
MKARRLITVFLSVFLLCAALAVPVSAEDSSRSYDFKLTADGQTEVTATEGQVLTFTLVLSRTDSSEDAEMYAMQAEFEYDDTFFALVENSAMTGSGIEWTDMARRTGGRVFYLNYVSMTGGQMWPSELLIGTFQLKVIAKGGVSSVTANNCLVSVKDGSDSFTSTCNDVRVIVGTECTVTFVSNGGSEVEAQKVQFGEKIKKPADPTREGYDFNGWYADLDRTKAWNFDTDTVQGNMTLYAGWLEASGGSSGGGSPEKAGGMPGWVIPAVIAVAAVIVILALLAANRKKKVTFETNGGTQLDPVYVKKGEKLDRPMTPSKPGAMFAGWFKDPDGTQPWIFERDTVEANMTLYARWR